MRLLDGHGALRPPPPARPTSLSGALEADTARDPFVVAPSQPAAGVILVRLAGELDMLTIPRSRRALTGAVDAVASEMARPHGPGGPLRGRVVCDLDGLDFVAASGLGMLVEVAEHARARRVELVLVASCRPVRRALDLTGLAHCFETVPSGDGLLGAIPGVAS